MENQPLPSTMAEYVERMKYDLSEIQSLARKHLKCSQEYMKRTYDQKAVAREFKEGDEVLVLSPVKEQPFNAKYQGPYVIEKRVNMVNYIISTPELRCKRQLCHINQLKGYVRWAEDRLVMAVQEITQNDEKGYLEREA